MTTAQRTAKSIEVTAPEGTFTLTGKATITKPIVVVWVRNGELKANATKDMKNAWTWKRELEKNSYDSNIRIVEVQ